MVRRIYSLTLLLLFPLLWGCVFQGTPTTMGLLEDNDLQGVDWVEVSFVGPVEISYHTINPVVWHQNATEGEIELSPDGTNKQLEFIIDHYNNQFPVCVFVVPSWGTNGDEDFIKVYGGPNPQGVRDDGTEFALQALTWSQMVTGYQQYVNPNSPTNNPAVIYWLNGHNEANALSGAGYDPQDPPLTVEGRLASVKVLRQGQNEANYSAQDVKNAIEVGPAAPGDPWGPMKNSQICASPGQYISFRVKSIPEEAPAPSDTDAKGPPLIGGDGKSAVPGGGSEAASSQPLRIGGGGCSMQGSSGNRAASSLAWYALMVSAWITWTLARKWAQPSKQS